MEKTQRTYAVIMQREVITYGNRTVSPPEYLCTVTEADADAMLARLCSILDADLYETYKAQQALNEPKTPYNTWREAHLDYKIALDLTLYENEKPAFRFACYSLYGGSEVRTMYLTRL